MPSLRALLLILGAVALAYGNALSGPFQFDDWNVIVFNPAVTQWPPDLSGLRPVLKLSHALNWHGKGGAAGFHAVNIAIHALNALLLFALAGQVARHHLEPRDAGRAALVAAVLFAVHPAHTEAVAYISGRSSSLMALFYLAGVLSYVRGREQPRPSWPHLLSPLCFALALLTKETALTLPFVLLLWEAVYGQGSWPDRLRRQGVHWALFGIALMAVAWHPGYRDMLVLAPSLDTLRTQIHGIGYLLSRWWLIHALNVDPDLRVQTAWTEALAAQAVSLLGLLAFGLWALRRRQWWAFAVFWLALQLLPGNSLVLRWDVANERQLYLAGMGVFVALGIEYARLRGRFIRGLGMAVLAVCVPVLMLFTLLRNHDYGSEVRLWQDAARRSPDKARVHNNLGQAYEAEGDKEKARDSYIRALELDPNYLIARNNLRAVRPEIPTQGR